MLYFSEDQTQYFCHVSTGEIEYPVYEFASYYNEVVHFIKGNKLYEDYHCDKVVIGRDIDTRGLIKIESYNYALVCFIYENKAVLRDFRSKSECVFSQTPMFDFRIHSMYKLKSGELEMLVSNNKKLYHVIGTKVNAIPYEGIKFIHTMKKTASGIVIKFISTELRYTKTYIGDNTTDAYAFVVRRVTENIFEANGRRYAHVDQNLFKIPGDFMSREGDQQFIKQTYGDRVYDKFGNTMVCPRIHINTPPTKSARKA